MVSVAETESPPLEKAREDISAADCSLKESEPEEEPKLLDPLEEEPEDEADEEEKEDEDEGPAEERLEE